MWKHTNNDFEDNYIPKVLLLCTKDSFHLENVQDKYCSTHMLEKQQMEQKYIDNAALQQEEPALTTGYRDKKITMDIIGSSILWSLHNVQL